jgi:hypothetical protein
MALTLFPLEAPNSSKPSTAVSSKKDATVTFLDAHRATLMNLVMTQMKQSPAQLAAAVNNMDTDVLTVSDDNYLAFTHTGWFGSTGICVLAGCTFECSRVRSCKAVVTASRDRGWVGARLHA